MWQITEVHPGDCDKEVGQQSAPTHRATIHSKGIRIVGPKSINKFYEENMNLPNAF